MNIEIEITANFLRLGSYFFFVIVYVTNVNNRHWDIVAVIYFCLACLLFDKELLFLYNKYRKGASDKRLVPYVAF